MLWYPQIPYSCFASIRNLRVSFMLLKGIARVFQRSKDTEVALEAFGVVVGNILFYEWLEDFEMFSIYEILPEILELWGDNLITQVDVKKNRQRAVGK